MAENPEFRDAIESGSDSHVAEPQPLPEPLQDPPAAKVYTFGPFRMDVATYQLFCEDREVELTSKVFDTLLLLVRNRSRVVAKEELLSTLWKDAVVTDDSLVQCISALRRALGDDATRPQYVATVSRRGYRFIAPVGEDSSAPHLEAAHL